MSESLQKRVAEDGSPSAGRKLGGTVSLFLRLWTYGGPSQPPSSLPLEHDPEIPRLLARIIAEGKGEVAVREPELLSARFDDPLPAISTAKALQQHFLTFHRKTEPQQVVPSILIYPAKGETPAGSDRAAPQNMLENVTSAQILVAAGICELVKDVPGFKFNPKPVREAGETFGPEAIYELLWTDESTYGHMRRASLAGLQTVGRYHIQEELGRGAMGAVYKAYDEFIGRTVALKIIPIDRDTPDRDGLIERLKQEAKAAGGLDHPNIITIYDVGQENDVVYLSMQFVKGTTLATLLDEVGVPSLPTFLSWADQISAGVGFAHACRVIHRDLKPANLMVTEQGIIKILDFGIAKIENASLTQTGLVVGTPSYMAPEQVAGANVDHRADIFTLGSVFYELLTSEKPFRGDVTTILYKIVNEAPLAPSLVNPGIPGGIDAIIRKALAKDPKDRFQDCEEMRTAFLEQAARLKIAIPGNAAVPLIVADPPESAQKLQAQPRRAAASQKSRWPVLSAAVLLLLLIAAGWVFYHRSQSGPWLKRIKDGTGAVHQIVSDRLQKRPDQHAMKDQSGVNKDAEPATLNPETQAGEQPGNVAVVPAKVTADTPEPSAVSPELSAPQALNNPPVADATQSSTSAMPPVPKTQPATLQKPGAGQPARAVLQTSPLRSDQDVPASKDDDSARNGDEERTLPQDRGKIEEASAAGMSKVKPPLTVDGFTRRDIPELLRQAEVAAQRGDYRLARYEYNLVLRLDSKNTRARQELRQIPPADQPH